MVLSNFEEVVFLRISSLDRYTKTILLGKIVDIDNLQGQSDDPGPYLLETSHIGVIDDLPPCLHPQMVTLLNQVVDVP